MFAHVLCMAFARLFNAEKKHVLNHFALEMAAIVVARRRHRRNQRLHGRRERIFSTRINLFGMPEQQIIQKFRLPSHVILNLLEEIQDDLEPSTRRSHAIPGVSKLLATLHFLSSGSFQSTVATLAGISQSAFSPALSVVLKSLMKIVHQHIIFPNRPEASIILPDKFTRLSAFIYRPVYHMHLQEHHLCLFATMR